MAIVFVIFLAIVLIISKKLYNSVITPFFLFEGIFMFSFALLLGSDFINYSLISDKMIFVYSLSFLFFLFGSILACHLCKKMNLNNTVSSDFSQSKYKRIIFVVFFIAAIATVIYWDQCVQLYGLDNLFSKLLESKESDNYEGKSNLVLHTKMLSVFLSPFTLNYIIKFKVKSPFYYFILLFTILANIAYTRMTVFYIIFLDLFVLLYSTGKTRKKDNLKKILLLTFFVMSFVSIFSYTQKLFNKEFKIAGSVFGMRISSGFATIVSYLCGPIVSSSIYVEQIRNVPILGFTLRSLFALFNTFGANIDISSYFPDTWVYIPFKFNTASIQFDIYSEGGILWTIIFFNLIGFLSSYLYLYYKAKRTTISMMALSLVSLILLFSTRSYLLTRLDIFIYIIMIFFVYVNKRTSFIEAVRR